MMNGCGAAEHAVSCLVTYPASFVTGIRRHRVNLLMAINDEMYPYHTMVCSIIGEGSQRGSPIVCTACAGEKAHTPPAHEARWFVAHCNEQYTRTLPERLHWQCGVFLLRSNPDGVVHPGNACVSHACGPEARVPRYVVYEPRKIAISRI
jgi:hypothetical protein